jgi:hypothetical protein
LAVNVSHKNDVAECAINLPLISKGGYEGVPCARSNVSISETSDFNIVKLSSIFMRVMRSFAVHESKLYL